MKDFKVGDIVTLAGCPVYLKITKIDSEKYYLESTKTGHEYAISKEDFNFARV